MQPQNLTEFGTYLLTGVLLSHGYMAMTLILNFKCNFWHFQARLKKSMAWVLQRDQQSVWEIRTHFLKVSSL